MLVCTSSNSERKSWPPKLCPYDWLSRVNPKAPKPDLSTPRLCRWVLHYAGRRRGPLVAVLLTMLLKVGLDVLKPWPMIFLVDHVLRTNVMPPWLASFVSILPG